MSIEPGAASPPKSGCSDREGPPMNVMNAADPLSTGAPLMSRFHQLLGGNSGSGGGNVPPSVATAAGCDCEPAGKTHSESAANSASGRLDRRIITKPNSG